MPKNNSLIISGMGVGMSILTSLVEKARRRGLSDEDFHNLATPEGEPILDQFVEVMVNAKTVGQELASRVIASFAITCKGYLASELVKDGKYDWHNELITDSLFPIQPHAPVVRKIEFVECDFDPSSEQALEELKRRGLKQPTKEDALEFGKEHPKEQRKRPIVFLHKPVLDPNGSRRVLVLDEDDGERNLRLGRFDDRWPRHDVFAGVRE